MRLSLTSSYFLRKILFVHIQNSEISYRSFGSESQVNLEDILFNLYENRASVEKQIGQLETLVRMYQVFASQKFNENLKEIENQILMVFKIRPDTKSEKQDRQEH